MNNELNISIEEIYREIEKNETKRGESVSNHKDNVEMIAFIVKCRDEHKLAYSKIAKYFKKIWGFGCIEHMRLTYMDAKENENI